MTTQRHPADPRKKPPRPQTDDAFERGRRAALDAHREDPLRLPGELHNPYVPGSDEHGGFEQGAYELTRGQEERPCQ